MEGSLMRFLKGKFAGWSLGLLSVAAFFALLAHLLPHGLPPGVVFLGLIDGALYALTAMGLVLLYRAQRIINFAQAEIGGLAVSVAVVAVTFYHLNYFVGVALGLLAAAATGVLAHFIVEWRFSNAPRMLLTVATLGMAELVGALEVAIPHFVHNQVTLLTFGSPFTFSFHIGKAFKFGGDHLVALGAAIACCMLLWLLLEKTTVGKAMRGAADSRERAQLLGIPVKRLSLITWTSAAVLSGVAALAAAPNDMGNPPDLTAIRGPIALLAPLAAAVIGRMESLSVTLVAGLVIGIFQQGVFWSAPRSSSVDVALFVAILLALLLVPPKRLRADVLSLAGYVNIRNPRPVPADIARLPIVRIWRFVVPLLLGTLAVAVPALAGQSVALPFAFIAVYVFITLSLVVLSGWGGQVSLGQSGFAGAGAATVAFLVVHAHLDYLLALLVAAVIGALFALAIGIPSMRIPGLFLAVGTLAFAVPVDTYLLNATRFPQLNPTNVVPPKLFGSFDLGNVSVFYVFASVVVALALVASFNLRHSRMGRALLAVRDNEAAASTYGLSPLKIRLAAFAIAGALAGLAGGFLVILEEGSGFSGFDPSLSFLMFIGAVIGGLGSIVGAVLGAVFIGLVDYYLSGALSLVLQGIFVLLFLMFLPEGLGGVVNAARERLIARLARARGVATTDGLDASPALEPVVGEPPEGSSVLSAHEVDASYGPVQVLFEVSLGVRKGEVLALLGTNGAGKSTLLKVFSGLIRPTKGYVRMMGTDISTDSPEELVAHGLVMVPGGRGVFPSLTVAENLELAAWLHRKDRHYVEAAYDAIFRLFPVLRHRLNTEARLLSGGEQQMLAIAQAILLKPAVLMIDELSLGLAPIVVSQLLEVVEELKKQGLTIILVEQSLNVAASIADRAVFLERGRVRFSGPLGQLTSRTDLARAVFLGDLRSLRQPGGDGSAPSLRPASTLTKALEVRGVSKFFGGVAAVNDVNLSVDHGEIRGLIGANGAGKTTLLDICSGFLRPDAGTVLFDGHDVTTKTPAARAKMGMGRVFQHAALYPSLTVKETLEVAAERFLYPKEPMAYMTRLAPARQAERLARELAEQAIEEFHLQPFCDRFVSELSTGTRRIVELACMMIHRPSLIFLDEPSSGLAQRESEALAELLLLVRERTDSTMVIVEHDIPLISSIASKITCMHLGEVIAEGPPREVLESEAVIEAFLGGDERAVLRSSGLVGR
jgi:ABC-type branched-subunit amino acid transport system ATPase component/ABC-type branched-subunit amino acid transport system permease subunit